jgi:NADH:ubiquinone oxidoreductase subunit 4 (subunit M)
MANISFPGTSSFIGEFLILVGSFKVNSTITFVGAIGIIIGGAYGRLDIIYLFLFFIVCCFYITTFKSKPP